MFKVNKLLSVVFVLIFFTIIYVISYKTIKINTEHFLKTYTIQDFRTKKGHIKIEDDFRNRVYKRDQFINIYGVLQRLLRRKVIGNFEFAITDQGILDVCRLNNGEANEFAIKLINLKKMCDDNNTKMLYIQTPSRNEDSGILIFGLKSYYEDIKKKVQKHNINLLNFGDIYFDNMHSIKEFYFGTDVHPTTDAEIIIADEVLHAINTNNIKLVSKNLYDEKKYYRVEHRFRGNLTYSLGKHYTKIDKFVEYYPLYSTEFEFRELYSNYSRKGSYQDAVLNGYQKRNNNVDTTYWVTNYMRFTSPAYEILNNKSNGPKILFVSDSMSYRTASYLSLFSKKVTMLDPRFFDKLGKKHEEIYSSVLKSDKYDIVVVEHGTFFVL